MMLSGDSEDNPMAALLRQAEKNQLADGSNQENNPLIVFGNDNNESNENDELPIGLSVRQPSFAHLTGNPVPKGGTESIAPQPINEPKSDNNENLGLSVRQSSYANLHLTVPAEKVNSPSKKLKDVDENSKKNMSSQKSNPIIVLTGKDDDDGDDDDDDDNTPIGLSVRQPSFASLHGTIIPKGGTDSGQLQALVIEEETDNNSHQSNKLQKKNDDDNLGLKARQSSYANLHLTVTPPKEEENPNALMALLEEHPNEKLSKDDNKAKESNPIIVLTGNDDDDDEDGDAPIGLSVRQPSFASLHGNVIPKGGIESAAMTLVIEEETESKPSQSNKLQKKNDDDNLGLKARQSSYANLHLTVTSPKEEKNPNALMALLEEHPNEKLSKDDNKAKESNPIIVLTGNDDDDEDGDAPIGLSVRQPSFASLHGNVIPKGGIESAAMTLVIEEEPETKSKQNNNSHQSNKLQKKNDDDNLGLKARQSSYANLHLTVTPPKEEENPNALMALLEEHPNEKLSKDDNKAKESNPIIVLTGNDDDDDEDGDAPIGLSVRQPSFASLHGNVIPKGGIESAAMTLVIEEEPESSKKLQKKNDDDNLGLKARQSSYANLHLTVTSPKEEENPNALMALLEENPKEEVEEKLQESNPIIVLTGNDDDDEDGDAPIGLSVRQPSFASLHGNVIPKGGIESAAMKLVIEEVPETKAEEDSNPKSSGRVEEENIGMQARQSSYANLHFNTSPDLEPNKIEPIIEPQQKDVIENPVIVLTAEDEKDDDAPIGLSVRQPSFASLHGNVIPKGGFTSSVPLIENIAEEPAKTQEDNNKSEIRLTEADSSTKEKILTSLHEFNKEWWEEIGYKPADKDFHRNNSCFILQNSKPVEKPKSNIKCCASLYQQNGSNTHGMNIVRGPSLVRVNSFGNKTEVKTVEMPIPDVELENDMSENIDEIEEEEEEGHHDEFEDENDLMTDYSDEREEQSPLKPLPVNRGPSLVRVSSFGNKSQVKYVEMPEIEDDIPQQQNSKPANQNSIQTKKNTSSNRRFKAHNNQSSSNSSINNVNSSNNISDNNSPENQSKPLKKLPTLVRVNSFGNKAELKMVEMPLTDDDEDEEYVYSDEEFYSNEETYESNIPPRILHLMKKPRNDMVINALSGDNIGNNQRETISKVLAELKSLLNMCVDKGYLMESQYITDTIEKVKNESGGAGIFELEEKMRDVEVELQDKLKDWQRQYEKIEVEQEEKLAECDEQYKHDLENLEEQFKEERRKTSTSKLTQLRQSAQKMMKASRFEESFQLSMKIYKKEMTQSQKQARSLSNAYITAKAQLREKYEEDKNQIVLSYETKRQAVTKKREQSLAPLRDQLLQYRKMKNIYEEAEKREQAVMTTQSRMRTGQTKTERNCALPSLSSGRK